MLNIKSRLLKFVMLCLVLAAPACSSSNQEQEDLETSEEEGEGDGTGTEGNASVSDIANAAAETAVIPPPPATNSVLTNLGQGTTAPAAAAAGVVAAADFANPAGRSAMFVTSDGAAVTDGSSTTPVFTMDRGDMVVVTMEGPKAKIINGRYIDPGVLSATPVKRSPTNGSGWTSP